VGGARCRDKLRDYQQKRGYRTAHQKTLQKPKSANKMKLPFINRKKYLVLKCYTDHRGVYEKAPITMNYSERLPEKKLDFMSRHKDFSSCYARIKAQKYSATLQAPAEFRFNCDENKQINYSVADKFAVQISFAHNDDHAYGKNRDNVVTKIMTPWRIIEETGTPFLLTRHIMNKTNMNIISGLVNFKNSCEPNIFNLVSTHPHQYAVPFLTPLASIYPLSDKPIHLEPYFDRDKYQDLLELAYKPRIRGNAMKSDK
jgi:hypothetical protein